MSACSWTFDESGGWFLPEIGSAVTGSNKRCGEHRKTLIVDERVKVGGVLVRHGADPGAGVEVYAAIGGRRICAGHRSRIHWPPLFPRRGFNFITMKTRNSSIGCAAGIFIRTAKMTARGFSGWISTACTPQWDRCLAISTKWIPRRPAPSSRLISRPIRATRRSEVMRGPGASDRSCNGLAINWGHLHAGALGLGHFSMGDQR